MHIAGLILARGGSKSIPLKNLALVGGKPLLVWALEAMIRSQGTVLYRSFLKAPAFVVLLLLNII